MRRGREGQDSIRGNRPLALAALGLVGIAGLIAFTGEDGPSCDGTQTVIVQPGDTLDGIRHDSINVTDGDYVDLDHVGTTINGQEVGGDVSPDAISPGDEIELPESCS
jgi:hypothetical protein